MKYVVLFSLTAVLVLSAAIQPFRVEMPLSVGATAPAFTLPSQDNTPVSLSDYRGKRVVLFFYPKEKTSGCALEAHTFQRDLEKHKAANAVVIGVSLDTVGSHRSFCNQKSLAFKLLADPGHKVVDAYGVEVKSLKSLLKIAPRQEWVENKSRHKARGAIRRGRVKVSYPLFISDFGSQKSFSTSS